MKKITENKDIKIFYIDPQSMRNLSSYDYWLLSEMNVKIFYICSKFYDYKINGNIKYYKVFRYNYINSTLIKSISYVYSYFLILFLIVQHKPDIIHIQWFKIPVLDYCFFRLVKRIFHTKLLFTAHNVLPHNSGAKYKDIYGKIYSLMDHVIVHTKSTKGQIVKIFSLPENKVSVIKHGILRMVFDKGKLTQEMDTFDTKYQFSNKLIFTSLGEQSHYKGIDVLIDVWANTPELNQSDDCKLVIIGKNAGLDFSPIEKMKNVIVEDRELSNEEYYYLLKHTDLYLIPYKEISQSGALLTAIAEHVPVLITRVGGLTDPFEIEEIGWSIPNCNVHDLGNLLINILKHPEEPRLIKKSSEKWENVCSYYDWKVISKTTQELYRKMLL